MFLGLDPATKCGWAAWSPGLEKPAIGSFALPSIEDDLGAVGFRVHVELNGLLAMLGFERVFYEAPIGPQKQSNTNLFTIQKALAISSHIESFCYAKKIRCRQVPMGSWRRYFVGKGAGEKSATFKAWASDRCRELGWTTRTHDEADACGVLAYGISLDPAFVPPWHEQLMFAEQFAPKVKRRLRA